MICIILCRFGRCKGMSGLCIASGVCLIGSIVGGSTLQTVAPSASVFIKVALAITGRLGNAAAFALAYFYATELFPTEVRCVEMKFPKIVWILPSLLDDIMSTCSL